MTGLLDKPFGHAIQVAWTHLRAGTLLAETRRRVSARISRANGARRERRWRQAARAGTALARRLDWATKILLYPGDRLAETIYQGGFEESECAFVRRVLRPGDCFVDVGANIGLFTLIAGRMVGPAGKVLSFEPSPQTNRRLLENVAVNRLECVQVLALALSDRPERRGLVVSLDGYSAWDSLGHPTAGAAFATTEVVCSTWDEVAARENLVGRVFLMKIDVEGWEERVLLGGEAAFSRSDAPHLVVEFTDQNALGAGTTCRATYRLLERLGYQMFRIGPELTLVPDPLRESYPYVNLVATKRIDELVERTRR